MKGRTTFLITLASLSLVLGGCQVNTTATPSSGTAQQRMVKAQAQPTTAKVDRRDIVGYRLMGGSLFIPPNAEASVLSNSAYPVQTVDAQVGEHVSKGQTLITLSTGQGGDYAEAKTTYDAALSAYNQAKVQYEQPVDQLRQQLKQAQTTERTLRQTTPPNGDATQLQQAVSQRRALEDQVKQAEVQAQASELPYKQQLDQARSALQQAQAGKNASRITSPISGTVISMTASPGQTLDGHTAFAKIVYLPAIQIKADVTPDNAPYVKKGTPVVIVFRDYPDHKFDGRVSSLDTLPAGANGTARYTATIDFDNTDGMIKPNASVLSVGVVVGHRSDVVAIPVDAVAKTKNGQTVVQIMQSNNWTSMPVQLGLTDGYFVEVKSGVQPGETVRVVPGQGQWLISTNAAASPAAAASS